MMLSRSSSEGLNMAIIQHRRRISCIFVAVCFSVILSTESLRAEPDDDARQFVESYFSAQQEKDSARAFSMLDDPTKRVVVAKYRALLRSTMINAYHLTPAETEA